MKHEKYKVSVRKLLFAGKLVLGLVLLFAAVRVVMIPRDLRSIFAPKSASGTDYLTSTETVPLATTPDVDYSDIIKHDIFSGTSSAPTNQSNAGDLSIEKELGIVLVGTIAGKPEFSRAIIKDVKAKVLGSYKTGDLVATAKIESVEKDAVILLHKGRRRVLNLGTADRRLPQVGKTQTVSTKNDQAIRKVESKTQQRSPGIVPAKFNGIETILTEAVIDCYAPDGETQGLRITGLENIPMAKKLGLKNGDVICAVNGQRLTGKKKAYQVFQKAKTQPAITFELLRDNKTKRLSFDLH